LLTETGASAFTYTVSIAKTNNTGVPITFALNPGGTATPGSDFTDFTGTVLSIPNGASTATYTANAVDDTLFENNETVYGTITSPSDPAINIVTGARTTTIFDNDNVNASINATLSAFAAGDEAGPTPLTFRVTLTKTNNTACRLRF
jgi:hypothetical protein